MCLIQDETVLGKIPDILNMIWLLSPKKLIQIKDKSKCRQKSIVGSQGVVVLTASALGARKSGCPMGVLSQGNNEMYTLVGLNVYWYL